MRYPAFLDDNGTIGLIAPSFSCVTEPYKSAFENAMKKLGDLGYRFDIGKNCYATDGIGISSTPKACGTEFEEYYISNKNDILIACGGGELMTEILDYIDFDRLKESTPKWFMGFSDNTNMTFLLTTVCDVASIYGPCVPDFGMEPWHDSIRDAYDVIRGKKLTLKGYGMWELEGQKCEEHPLLPYNITEKTVIRRYPDEDMSFEGRLVGGCLDILTTFVGTKYDKVREFNEKYKEDGIIWYIEACDLSPISVRRSILQLSRASWFENVKGFVIGRPRLYGQEEFSLDHYQAMYGVLEKYNVPIVMDVDLGHLKPTMPLINGCYAKVDVIGNDVSIDMQLK